MDTTQAELRTLTNEAHALSLRMITQVDAINLGTAQDGPAALDRMARDLNFIADQIKDAAYRLSTKAVL